MMVYRCRYEFILHENAYFAFRQAFEGFLQMIGSLGEIFGAIAGRYAMINTIQFIDVIVVEKLQFLGRHRERRRRLRTLE